MKDEENPLKMNISPHLCKKLNAQYEEAQKKKLQEESVST